MPFFARLPVVLYIGEGRALVVARRRGVLASQGVVLWLVGLGGHDLYGAVHFGIFGLTAVRRHRSRATNDQ